MKSTHIYLIRHGESMANERDAFIGHTDLDLTQKGHMQAEKTAEYLKNIDADVIYSSDLIRAYHTAEHTARMKGLEIIKDKNLREIYAGEWEDKTFYELEEKYADSYGVWLNDIGRAVCDGGESVEDMAKRVIDEFNKIINENEGKTIFIFSHGTPIRVLRAFWTGKGVDDLKDVAWASNASVSHVEYIDGKVIIHSYSNDSFLGDMATILPDNV